MKVVIFGLSVTSSWGNGHATTYRALMRALAWRGHDVLFLERDVPWYAANRDLPRPRWGRAVLYESLDELRLRYAAAVQEADLVVVGSYVPDGAELGEWALDRARGVRAFYDIDTPVTLDALARGRCDYLTPALIPRYDLYLSFTGGEILRTLERVHGARRACPLYCSVDPAEYGPQEASPRWDLGYLGTYSDDRQPRLEELLLEPARRLPRAQFCVAGPLYPPDLDWPGNVTRFEHLAPPDHPSFYAAQRFTLNVTRAAMVSAGYSPSIRLFEAAACATPVISDRWEGIEAFFEPEEEILLADGPEDVAELLALMSERERRRIGRAARARALACHTPAARAAQLEGYVAELVGRHAHARSA